MKLCITLAALAASAAFALPLLPIEEEVMAVVQGEATYYTEWVQNPGSCGYIPTVKNIVALPTVYMPHCCGQCVRINQGSKSVVAVVTDTCPSCAHNHIDLSDALFQQLAPKEKGKIAIKWRLIPCPPHPGHPQ